MMSTIHKHPIPPDALDRLYVAFVALEQACEITGDPHLQALIHGVSLELARAEGEAAARADLSGSVDRHLRRRCLSRDREQWRSESDSDRIPAFRASSPSRTGYEYRLVPRSPLPWPGDYLDPIPPQGGKVAAEEDR